MVHCVQSGPKSVKCSTYENVQFLSWIWPQSHTQVQQNTAVHMLQFIENFVFSQQTCI